MGLFLYLSFTLSISFSFSLCFLPSFSHTHVNKRITTTTTIWAASHGRCLQTHAARLPEPDSLGCGVDTRVLSSMLRANYRPSMLLLPADCGGSHENGTALVNLK